MTEDDFFNLCKFNVSAIQVFVQSYGDKYYFARLTRPLTDNCRRCYYRVERTPDSAGSRYLCTNQHILAELGERRGVNRILTLEGVVEDKKQKDL